MTQAVADEIRDAVVFLRSHGDPMATVTGFVDVAARRELDRLKKQYRIDEFPVSDVVFPPGRVAGR